MEASKINVGDFDTRIVIEQHTVAKDGRGEVVKQWNVFATVWAKVEEPMSSEVVESNQVLGKRTINVTMHWRTGVASDMRIKYNDEDYYIGGSGVLGRKQFLVLTATNKTNS